MSKTVSFELPFLDQWQRREISPKTKKTPPRSLSQDFQLVNLLCTNPPQRVASKAGQKSFLQHQKRRPLVHRRKNSPAKFSPSPPIRRWPKMLPPTKPGPGPGRAKQPRRVLFNHNNASQSQPTHAMCVRHAPPRPRPVYQCMWSLKVEFVERYDPRPPFPASLCRASSLAKFFLAKHIFCKTAPQHLPSPRYERGKGGML